ncbi:hypothetical protein AAZX31_16G083300 [Glycine max]|uniref:RINb protein n=2 Tax=Glycine subgen. Soja TaxID=1462606 RepID=C6TH04_SOYBN|nr:RPM1-interacting protein 4-like [Glycine max]XP_028207488.1 RPM1-interacting protein 4-like [Glycine soja]ACU21106.1 unknown [Glycine max]ADJ67444.1 RINb protein [Glycine max]KAG4938701.1 hypothetical protein JHK86_044842 [Glycine max]KAG4951590.1 hypothetical protein JHK85_045457 [Glycine max]KAG5099444.1 hypothetical protein JHK82_044496 [Glycine max]|eukprot:NP_001239973.1 RPM1-interacting protein 4-like [Glycine max]
MAQRSHVPKFGNWDSGENVPYTAYFDKARKGRTGTRIINPNDPEENADLSFDNPSSDNLPPTRPRTNSEDQSGKGSLHLEDDPKNFIESPARHDNVSSRSGSRSHGVGSADNRRRHSTQSTGSEYSIERSPLHRQARAPGRDSPQWEPKNSYDSSQGTPGRSRLRPANRGDETPDKGAAVPKFGDWDVNNPASADGFTHIFNKVREERQGGPGQVPGTPNERPQPINGLSNDDKVQCCCFAWGGKK